MAPTPLKAPTRGTSCGYHVPYTMLRPQLNSSACLNCASKGGIVPLQKAISYLSLSLYWQQSSKRWKTQHMPLVITHKSTRDPSLRSGSQPLACHPERSEGSVRHLRPAALTHVALRTSGESPEEHLSERAALHCHVSPHSKCRFLPGQMWKKS